LTTYFIKHSTGQKSRPFFNGNSYAAGYRILDSNGMPRSPDYIRGVPDFGCVAAGTRLFPCYGSGESIAFIVADSDSTATG